jgi:hypothetical protein
VTAAFSVDNPFPKTTLFSDQYVVNMLMIALFTMHSYLKYCRKKTVNNVKGL